MKLRIYHILLLIISLVFGITSCTDDFLSRDSFNGKGESTIRMEVNFRQFTDVSPKTRSAGDSYDYIRSLFVIVYNEAGTEVIKKESVTVSGTDNTQVLSNLVLPFGKYQIYAVANMGELSGKDYSTVGKLKSIRLQWSQNNEGLPGENDQMLGYFAPAESEGEGPVIIINKPNMSLKAELVRAASKVTVAYDGSRLNDGVTIEFRSVEIKDIADGCFLGSPSKVGENSFGLIENGEKVSYPAGTQISNLSPYFPVTSTTNEDGNPVWDDTNNPHAHTSDYSLFFYENMQGTGPDKRQEFDKDGNLVNPDEDKPVPNGTYIEVDAHYTSTNPERPGVGNIKYRFLLGKNVTTNYDAERNHHFKLTLVFKGYADNPDWEIEVEQFLEAPGDQHVDYRGEKFYPQESIPNLGHTFGDDVYTIRSYARNIETGETVSVPYEITFSTDGKEFSKDNKPAWLTVNDPGTLDADHSASITFSYATNPSKSYTVSNLLTATGGTATAPKDLTENEETANCYIVSGSGYYKFPLVYGNGRYSDNPSTGSDNPSGDLATFKNYLKDNESNGIKSKYILDDIYTQRGKTIPATGLTAALVWEDESYLVDHIKYEKSETDNGYISFSVGTGTSGIREGNAVIALKDPDGNIMWSWHIWVTTDKFKNEWAMTLTDTYSTWLPSYKIMPVNLGWCSGGSPLVYYEKRECQVKITAGDLEKTIRVVQEPHLDVPVGNSPYYQWGRKDPFVAARNGTELINNYWGIDQDARSKLWYYYNGGTYTSTHANPPLLNPDDSDDAHTKRDYTKDILWELIRKPNTWNNPRCKGASPTWESDDQIYANLWTDGNKTCYDPCPVGFQVSPYETFAVTVRQSKDWSPLYPDFWFNMEPSRMSDRDEGLYKYNVVEFYTNSYKYISLGFPEVGYRDYDFNARILDYPGGYIWLSRNLSSNNSYYFRYYLKDNDKINEEGSKGQNIVAPFFGFYPCDGFCVRPTAVITRQTDL